MLIAQGRVKMAAVVDHFVLCLLLHIASWCSLNKVDRLCNSSWLIVLTDKLAIAMAKDFRHMVSINSMPG